MILRCNGEAMQRPPNLKKDLQPAARGLAQATNCSTGAVVDRLLRQSVEAVQTPPKETGLPVSAGRRPIKASEIETLLGDAA